MEALEQRICQEARILPGNIIKVDGFLNHHVDTLFLGELADEFAKQFDISSVTKILASEANGIALAAICAFRYGLPMVFAKISTGELPEDGQYHSTIFSYVYRKKITLLCSQEWLTPEDRVLIIDDFMGSGAALQGLLDIVTQSGAQLMGVGVAVEKGFQHGGDNLRRSGYPLKSLAIIDSIEDNRFVFRKNS